MIRLLVFEYMTGGGFVGRSLPDALLHEGCLMRHALLDDLKSLKVDVWILTDERVPIRETEKCLDWQYLTICEGDNLQEILQARQAMYDVVWLIAPETDGLLSFWSHFFVQQGKVLASCGTQAIDICQGKLGTFDLLDKAGIPSVPSYSLCPSTIKPPFPCVIKANNSVGCDQVYLVTSEQQWEVTLLKCHPEEHYITQPFVVGRVLSLSCLFHQGQAYFICCNEQHISHCQGKFELVACLINVQDDKTSIYQALCQQIVEAIPSLFGYIGIDFIYTDSGESLILEINPRLTSSYAGIKEAVGLNIAEIVLGMLNQQQPDIRKLKNQQVRVDIKQVGRYAT